MKPETRAQEWLASYRTHDAAWFLRELFQNQVIRFRTGRAPPPYSQCPACTMTCKGSEPLEHTNDCLIAGAWRAAYVDKPLPYGDTIEGEE